MSHKRKINVIDLNEKDRLGYQPLSQGEIDRILPVLKADLKYVGKPVTDASVKAALYKYVIREMYDDSRFLHHQEEDSRTGCYIKGYVQDVWSYLSSAYDLIHGQRFMAEQEKLDAI